MATRRKFLVLSGTGVAASLAGCSRGETGTLSMTRMESDQTLGEELTHEVDPETSPEHVRILREVIESGSSNVYGDLEPGAYHRGEDGEDDVFENDETGVAARPPWMPNRPVVREGQVYEITWTSIAEETRTIYEVRATPAGEKARDPQIEFSDLPALDRQKLERLPPTVGMSSDFSVANRYVHDEVDSGESAFVPDQEHEVIEVDGVAVAIETRSTPATVTTFRYDAEKLADSVTAYGAATRASHEFVLDSLEEDEQEIVEEAIGGAYTARGEDGAFKRVVERFDREQEVIERNDQGGTWLAEYEGSSYWSELDIYGDLDGSDWY